MCDLKGKNRMKMWVKIVNSAKRPRPWLQLNISISQSRITLRNHERAHSLRAPEAPAGGRSPPPRNDKQASLVAKLTQNPTLTFHVEFARPETSDTPKHEVNMLALWRSLLTAVKHVRAAERWASACGPRQYTQARARAHAKQVLAVQYP